MEFPLSKKVTRLGSVSDPKIPVAILTKFGYQTLNFILDSGADFSMLPKHIAEIIGIDLKNCSKDRSYGIEGTKGVAVWLGKIQAKIGKEELRIHCLFSENPSCPYILGRMDIFSNFNVIFDNKNEKIKLIRITPPACPV